MNKNLYFHSSNLEYMEKLNSIEKFEPFYKYKAIENINKFQYEFGRIKIGDIYFHFLLGKIKQEGCPWCKGICKIKHVDENHYTNAYLFIYCVSCGCQGPKLNYIKTIENPEFILNLEELAWNHFNHRKPWDSEINS